MYDHDSSLLKLQIRCTWMYRMTMVVLIFEIEHVPKIFESHHCMVISLLSVIGNTLEKSLLPYITANIPNTPTQHSTATALHTLNNTVAKEFKQRGRERTCVCPL